MLTLFGTDGCHLCHDAQALLARMNLAWQEIDIVNDDALLERYGIRIPVLRRDQQEIDWPFDEADIRHLLGQD